MRSVIFINLLYSFINATLPYDPAYYRVALDDPLFDLSPDHRLLVNEPFADLQNLSFESSANRIGLERSMYFIEDYRRKALLVVKVSGACQDGGVAGANAIAEALTSAIMERESEFPQLYADLVQSSEDASLVCAASRLLARRLLAEVDFHKAELALHRETQKQLRGKLASFEPNMRLTLESGLANVQKTHADLSHQLDQARRVLTRFQMIDPFVSLIVQQPLDNFNHSYHALVGELANPSISHEDARGLLVAAITEWDTHPARWLLRAGFRQAWTAASNSVREAVKASTQELATLEARAKSLQAAIASL